MRANWLRSGIQQKLICETLHLPQESPRFLHGKNYAYTRKTSGFCGPLIWATPPTGNTRTLCVNSYAVWTKHKDSAFAARKCQFFWLVKATPPSGTHQVSMWKKLWLPEENRRFCVARATSHQGKQDDPLRYKRYFFQKRIRFSCVETIPDPRKHQLEFWFKLSLFSKTQGVCEVEYSSPGKTQGFGLIKATPPSRKQKDSLL